MAPAGKVVHRPVCPQIIDRLWRTVCGKVIRRCAHDHGNRCQLARDHAGGRQVSDPQHAIDAIGQQIDGLIADAKDQVHLGIERLERGHVIDHERSGKRDRYVDTQAPARFGSASAEQVLCLVYIRQQADRPIIKLFSFPRQADPAGGALEQTCTDLSLQSIDGIGDAGAGQAQGLRRAGKAAVVDHGNINAEVLSEVHR